MISIARSAKSRSLLREAKDCLLVLQTRADERYFYAKIAQMVALREDPAATLTGAKALKTELLGYLAEFGEVRTANVWARNLPANLREINALKAALAKPLREAGCRGVVEVHFSDREINSPHLQFVGTNARAAEQIIAAELVARGFETSVQNAVGRGDFAPFFERNPQARTTHIDDAISWQERAATEHETAIENVVREAAGDEFVEAAKERADGIIAYVKSAAKESRERLRGLETTAHKTLAELKSAIDKLKEKLGLK